MYKYVSKTKYRFRFLCISIGVRQFKIISLSLFECSFQVSLFLDSQIQEAPIQSRRVLRNNACEAKSHMRIYKFFRREGGGGLQPLLTNLSTIMISVQKAGLGATLKKAQNGPVRVISLTRGGGGGLTLPLKPPMKPVTNVCAENVPFRVKWFINLIGSFHQFRHVFDMWSRRCSVNCSRVVIYGFKKQVVSSGSCPSCTTLKKTILICQIRGDLKFSNSCNIFLLYVYTH